MVGNGNVVGCPAGQISTLPKSFSVNSSRSSNDEDLRELIRAASTRNLGNKVEADLMRQKQLRQSATTRPKGVPRSFSVGIGRIEEDKPCEFGEHVNVKTDGLYPRSRSYAVSKRPERCLKCISALLMNLPTLKGSSGDSESE
ncbi:hypothetical protein HHK36_031048 [Tetracentron sinense]|uniref:Uncharacterized protein n=1 Tax=Tetracentron sinense TaxID=13715 RepID=A0A834YDW8_TETSI|nr:hypothetical protein HHK36_031048 [Tetracentron sinense]